MTDWREHNGGPQPVDDAVWVERDDRYYNIECAPAKAFEWGGKRFRFRILNQHLIDGARLEGIRLGLEAAAQAIKALREDCDNLDREMAFEVPLGAVQDLKPDTIAKEAGQ